MKKLSGGGFERHGIAESAELSDETVGGLLFVVLLEVVGGQIDVGGVVAKHVVGRGEDGGSDGYDGLLWAAMSPEAKKLSLEVGAFDAGGGPGRLNEDRLEPRVPGFESSRAMLPGAFVATWAQPSPGDQVLYRWEPRHVGADFGEDHQRDDQADARDGHEPFDVFAKGPHHRFDVGIDGCDGVPDLVDLLEVQLEKEAVMIARGAACSRDEAVVTCLEAAIRDSHERFGIALAGDDGLQHRPPG